MTYRNRIGSRVPSSTCNVRSLSWRQCKVATLSCVVGMAVWCMALQTTEAEAPDDSAPGAQQLDPQEAWTQLRESAQKRFLASRGDQTAYMKQIREILQEIEDFATTYPQTEESTVAWHNHGILAARIGDYVVADRSLETALKQATDRDLQNAIRAERARIAIRPGGTPPAFTAKSLDDRAIALTDFKGKVLLLDFWATWCGPCIAELPNIKKVYANYHEKGLEILSISLDTDVDALRSFVKKEDLNWSHIHNSPHLSSDIATLYGVSAIPQLIVIGRDGKITNVGLRGRALESAIQREINVEFRPGVDGIGRPKSASMGELAPSLAVTEWLRGKPTSLDALKGKVVLLDFFQIICSGCRRAHPQIVRMQDRYRAEGLEVLGLAVAFEHESAQTPQHIRKYVGENQFPYPVAIDEGLVATFNRYRARGTPFTAVIDRKGHIRYLDFFRLNRVESIVQQLLAEES